ncbi:MAG: hypothetical protein PW792_14935 [Acidobacteriaceae bacterium]|nr:hypothetical protein [Acidobacteriaceae bacterium]
MSTRAIVCLMAVVCLGGMAAAQDSSVKDTATSALEHGRLTVWIVHPAHAGWSGDPSGSVEFNVTLPTTVQEQTAGSFGKNASDTGQTASTYGANASDVGTSASNVGQTAGSAGTDPGSFGRPSSEVGQTAGSYGQTASSYGETVASLSSGNSTNPSGLKLSHHHAESWDRLVSRLHADFPGLDVRMEDVQEEDLVASLRGSVGTSDAPDVLVGEPLPWKWAQMGSGAGWHFVLAPMGATKFPVQVEGSGIGLDSSIAPWKPEVAIVSRTPHPKLARGFAVWLADGGRCQMCAVGVGPAQQAVADAALATVRSVLSNGLPDAHVDKLYARSDAEVTRAAAVQGTHPVSLEGLHVRTDLMELYANDRLAVAEVRGVLEASSGFGVLHSFVVARADAAGKWNVLQVTSSMTLGMARTALDLVRPFAEDMDDPGDPKPVSQAAPAENAVVSGRPELWWDNHDGAQLEVVEWQIGAPGHWAGSRLFFVPDRGIHLRTRATADFATETGTYRWRVWSVGQGGVLVLTPWRGFRVDH